MKNTLADFNFFYSFFRPVVDYGTHAHYRSVTIKGRENIPWNEHFIFAPCHQNALMDALLMLCITRQPVVFLARADIFNNPTIAAFLNFLRISPVYRIRDGRDQLGKNEQVFNNSCDVLLKGRPLCLMAEGRHNDKHQMLPLVKGMFRIAGETQKRLGDKPLYIVPMGVDYDEYEQTYSNVCINIGKPIPVQEYMDTYLSNEPVALNQMRETLSVSLKGQMHHVTAKERYADEYAYCHRQTAAALAELNLKNTAWNRFMARKHISEQIAAMSDEQKELCYDQGSTYAAELNQAKIPLTFDSSFLWHKLVLNGVLIAVVVAAILSTVGLKFWILSNLIVYLPTHIIAHKLIKDTQFRSSINYGIRLFATFLYVIIGTIVTIFAVSPIRGLMFLLLGTASAYLTPRLFIFLRDLLYAFRRSIHPHSRIK